MRGSKDSGVRKSRTYGGNKATPMSKQEQREAKLRQATSSQRLAKAGGGKANGNKMARREYNKGGVATAMKTAKPC